MLVVTTKVDGDVESCKSILHPLYQVKCWEGSYYPL